MYLLQFILRITDTMWMQKYIYVNESGDFYGYESMIYRKKDTRFYTKPKIYNIVGFF